MIEKFTEYLNLKKWGLSEQFDQHAKEYNNLLPARVTEQHRNNYKIISENGFLQASVSGKFIHCAKSNSDYPSVGDWVMFDQQGGTVIIHHILPRKSVFLRKAAGTSHQTQIAASYAWRLIPTITFED